MKITAIDLIQVERIPENAQIPVFTRIHTDEGISGTGEVGVAILGFSAASAKVVEQVAPLLIGQNPLHHDRLWETLLRKTFWGQGNGGVIMGAYSAIDTALWDIKGKFYNAPVHELLGGKYRDRLWSYASQLQGGWKRPEFLRSPRDLGWFREAYQAARQEGYDAIKVDLLVGPEGTRFDTFQHGQHISHAVLRDAEAKLTLAREIFGQDAEIILENHAATEVNGAIELARIAEPFRIMYYEEPVTNLNPDQFKRISEATSIPLATGERVYTRYSYLPYLENRSVAVVQPDVGNCGGITEARRIADLAHIWGVGVQSHTCNSPLSVAAALQFEAAIPNFVIHETHTTNGLDAVRRLGVHDYQPVDGWFTVPDLPGIGEELSDWALDHATITTLK